MKKKIGYWLLCLIGCGVVGCEQTPEEIDYKSCSLSVGNEIVFEGEGTLTQTIQVETTRETMWRIKPETNASWIEFQPLEGKDSGEVLLSVGANPGAGKRTGNFLFEAFVYGERYFQQQVTVTQMPAGPYLEVSGDIEETGLSFNFEGVAESEIQILSNREWTIATAVSDEDDTPLDWLILGQESGSGIAAVTFEVLRNSSREERTGFIVLKSQTDGLTCRIAVTQKAYSPELVEEFVLTILGMTEYLADGTSGTAVLTSGFDGSQVEWPAAVSLVEGNTLLTFTDAASGDYTLERFKTEDGTEYVLGVAVNVSTGVSGLEISGWDNNFKTFGGDSEENPIKLLTAEDLRTLATVVNAGNAYAGKYFKLMQPVDLSGSDWEPIGNKKANPFRGSFDGNDQIIRGMHFDATNMFFGLFGVVSGTDADHLAQISNIRLEGAGNGDYDIIFQTTNQTAACGGVLGLAMDHAVISNCTVNLRMHLSSNCGGIVGDICNNDASASHGASQWPQLKNGQKANVRVENCHNRGNIDVTIANTKYKFNLGGIVGKNMGTIERCSNTGDIQGAGIVQLGGIVGVNLGDVLECYNTGDLLGGNGSGGIVGMGVGTCATRIENCYNTGDILYNHNTAGGILGTVGDNANAHITLINCYSIGSLTQYAGALIGDPRAKPTYVVRFCASDKAKLLGNQTNGLTGDTEMSGLKWGDRIRQFSMEQLRMQATFVSEVWATSAAGWDFTNIWTIDEGSSTPYLRNNPPVEKPGR